jgi:hypothetical protein
MVADFLRYSEPRQAPPHIRYSVPFNRPIILLMHDTITYIHGAIPLAFYSPLLIPLCLPFVSPFTYLAPSSCDRNCSPRSQVVCKLTPFAPPFTQLTPSLQIPRTPTAQRVTKTTSGIFRLLLSGTDKVNDDHIV